MLRVERGGGGMVSLEKTEIKPQRRQDEITGHLACHAEEVEFYPGGNWEPLNWQRFAYWKGHSDRC